MSDMSPRFSADLMILAAAATSNAWFASLGVLVFLHVRQDVSFEKSSVETGAV